MATVTRENIGLLNEKIIVKVEKDDYFPSFQKAIKDYSKKANIPGFRKGMVPVGMIKKMVGSSFFAEEVNKTVEKELIDYMQTEKLEIFAQPLALPENDNSPLDMNQPTDYAFAFEVGLKPEFAIADLRAANLTRYKILVTDEMVNQQIEQLQTRGGITTDQETVTSSDNILDLEFIESDAEANEVEGGIIKQKSLLATDFTPAFREQFMGKKIDESIVLKFSEAFEENEKAHLISDFNFENEEIQAVDKYFNVRITNIKLLEKAELNEDLFKQIFPDKNINTEEEFKNKIRQDIQTQWDNQSRNHLMDQIYHELLNHTHIEFPEHFLKKWMLISGEKQNTPEEIEKDFPSFVNNLKWTLILDKLISDKNIEVLSEDIRQYAKNQLIGYMGSSIDLDQPWVENYLDKMTKDKKYVEDSYHRLRTEKFFAWAETQVNPAESIISAEDFGKMQEEHKHHH